MRLAFLLAVWVLGTPAFADVLPGVARIEAYRAELAGKRIGLVVNQASVFHGRHTIDFLLAHAKEGNFRVTRLFALEHGVRGEGGAGEEIKDGIDPISGLPVISLYGAKKKPLPADLAGLDIVIYDIQDVGVRFFTYISSLGLIMEACAGAGVRVMVMDRPNPNDYVEGPVLEHGLKSFVGAYPIPVVYGLTAGELARMIVGERWQAVSGLELKVVGLEGWKRGEPVALEVRPSPGLRSPQAIRAYPSVALFEPTRVSVGRGTAQPFAQYGMPLTASGGRALGSHRFTPADSLYKGQQCRGEEFFSRAVDQVPAFSTDLFSIAYRLAGPAMLERESFLRLLVGDRSVVRGMLSGVPYAELRRGFAPGLARYLELRKKYLLY